MTTTISLTLVLSKVFFKVCHSMYEDETNGFKNTRVQNPMVFKEYSFSKNLNTLFVGYLQPSWKQLSHRCYIKDVITVTLKHF